MQTITRPESSDKPIEQKHAQYTPCWNCQKPMLITRAPRAFFSHLCCSVYCSSEMLDHYK